MKGVSGPMVDIRGDFERLRDEDAARVPAFESVSARSVSAGAVKSRRPRLSVGLAAAAMLVIAGVWLAERSRPGSAETELATALTTGSAVEWTSSTDFLLELPGSELLRAVPELGRPPVLPSTGARSDGASVDTARKGNEQS